MHERNFRLSAILKAFCFVPHLIDEYTLSQDSMKIYDYLSQGKPVVTVNIPPAEVVKIIVMCHTTTPKTFELISAVLRDRR